MTLTVAILFFGDTVYFQLNSLQKLYFGIFKLLKLTE